jgi:hypothetical protein
VSNGQTVTDMDKYVNMTLLYLLTKATKEIKGLHRSKVMDRIGMEVGQVQLS